MKVPFQLLKGDSKKDFFRKKDSGKGKKDN